MKEIQFFSYKVHPFAIIAILALLWFIIANVFFSTMNMTLQQGLDNTVEGFSSGWTSVPLFSKAKSLDYITPPSTWDVNPVSYSKQVYERTVPPMQPGQLDMFSNTPFRGDCCPNTYSSGSGCACMTMGQYDSLKNRGGNNE